MTYGHRKGHSKRMQEKKAEAAEKKLAAWIISVQVLENGARFYKLKPGPALGAEFMETWRNRL